MSHSACCSRAHIGLAMVTALWCHFPLKHGLILPIIVY
jgi:hypothetical protein